LSFPEGDDTRPTLFRSFPNPEDSSKSILIMNVHPSVHDFLDHQTPLRQTTAEAFAPEALYELKIDTNGDAIADIAYRELEITHKTSHGLFFQANYTWTHDISDAQGDVPAGYAAETNYGLAVVDRFDIGLDRGNVAGARRQRFLLTGSR
jgi:hypothetical protein